MSIMRVIEMIIACAIMVVFGSAILAFFVGLGTHNGMVGLDTTISNLFWKYLTIAGWGLGGALFVGIMREVTAGIAPIFRKERVYGMTCEELEEEVREKEEEQKNKVREPSKYEKIIMEYNEKNNLK